MGFKDNLLKKIQIDRLSRQAVNSLGPPESSRKIDKAAMRSLLEMSPYQYQRERDLDLHIRKFPDAPPSVLVLDNELPIYRTEIADVAMRKSPTVKEMISVSNVIKILNDKDVKESQREASIKTIHAACLEDLDLSFSQEDIQDIAADGQKALEAGNENGVAQTLELFAELLEWTDLSKTLDLPEWHIFGQTEPGPRGGKILYGPMVCYDPVKNRLMFVEDQVSNADKAAMDLLEKIASGKKNTDIEGPAVLDRLQFWKCEKTLY